MIETAAQKANEQSQASSSATSQQTRQLSAPSTGRASVSVEGVRAAGDSSRVKLGMSPYLIKSSKLKSIKNTPNSVIASCNSRRLASPSKPSSKGQPSGENNSQADLRERVTEMGVQSSSQHTSPSHDSDKGGAPTRQLTKMQVRSDERESTIEGSEKSMTSQEDHQQQYSGEDNTANQSAVDQSLVPQTCASSLKLAAPWRYYRRHVSISLAKWCAMCDKAEVTTTIMRRDHPFLFRDLSLFDNEPVPQDELEETISDFAESLEQLLPSEHKECLMYALQLIEKGFGLHIYVNKATVKRLLAIAYSFAYKMLSEIDWMSLNVSLAKQLGISLAHFNQIEASVLAAYSFDIGISAEQFKEHFAKIDESCLSTYQAQVVKAVQSSSQKADSGMGSSSRGCKRHMTENSTGPLDDTASEETKVSSESRQDGGTQRKRLGSQHPSGYDVCSSPDSVASSICYDDELGSAATQFDCTCTE